MTIPTGWRKTTLADVCSLRGGAAFKPALQGRSSGDYPFIKVRDFNSNQNLIRITGADHWVDTADTSSIQGRPFAAGISVFAKIGEALKHNRVRFLTRETFIDNNLMGAVPKPDVIAPHFLFQLLRTFDFAATNAGTAVPYLTAGSLGRSEILVPPLEIQHRIASILGGYDDLIEVNRRRIALLEEMARRLFEEWFVHFRFPGQSDREFTENANGRLPSGWRLIPLGEALSLAIGGTWGADVRDDENTSAARVVRGTDFPGLRNGVYSSVPSRFVPPRILEKRTLSPSDIVMEVSGGSKDQPVGRVTFVSQSMLDSLGNTVTFASFCRLLRVNRDVASVYQVYWSLDQIYRSGQIEAYQTQSTGLRNLKFGVMSEKQTLCVPSADVRAAFDEIMEAVMNALGGHSQQISILQQSRDLLLPRLVSGELSVAAAERELETAA